ncbi:MAG: hypothetical protein IJI53_12635 [Clostridia bacterium]|nr:hypothetical protein [Clostridia bacterium]MBR0408879.1 hypothetical protein [Clostridia bacterium]
MDQLSNELKKMVKAGMGAVATGMEMTQEAIDTFAKKGEPIYQQAKAVVTDAADKVMQAVNDGIQCMNVKPGVEEIIGKVKELTQEEWEQIRGAVDDFFAQAKESAESATPDGAADAETPEQTESAEEAKEAAEEEAQTTEDQLDE